MSVENRCAGTCSPPSQFHTVGIADGTLVQSFSSVEKLKRTTVEV